MGGAFERDILDKAGQDDEVPELLTVAEAAVILRCHRNTVYAQIRRYFATDGAEGIPAIRMGARVYVLRQELEKRLGIKILRVPPRNASRDRGREMPRITDAAPTRRDVGPSHATQPRSGQAKKAPVGYVDRFVAQWRLRR